MSFIDNITDFIFIEDEPQKSDIIFIPGSGYCEAAEKAAEIYRGGFCDKVLPSGRYSILNGEYQPPITGRDKYNKNYTTEWEFLQDILIQGGVAKESILKEDQATYTYENAIYSRKVTDSLGLRIEKAILCCHSFHSRRSLMYYQLLYPNTHFYVCPTPTLGITRENWFYEEDGRERILGEVERCGSQFHQIVSDYAEKHKK